VLVLSCGGTISSVRTGEAGAKPVLDAAALVAGLPELGSVARVEAAAFSALPSSHVTLERVLALQQEVVRRLDAAADDPFHGVVITHGTDTLEEVAFGLDLLWHRSTPLIVTGAMRNASLPGADGPANLLAAAVTAGHPQARSLGVLVVFNDEIHAAGYVRKTHTSNVAAFQSPTVGPLGYLAEGIPRFVFAGRQRHPLTIPPSRVGDTAVALLKLGIGDDGRLLPAIAGCGYRGLVIEGYGGGHVSLPMAESSMLDDLVAVMPVVLASRTGSGATLYGTYDYAGSEVDLLPRGLIPAGDLDGLKARVLLTFLLAAGTDLTGIVRAFAVHGRLLQPDGDSTTEEKPQTQADSATSR
jgi:L-asparaginase